VVTWHVAVHTSDIRGAGTDANVWLVAYGRIYGKSKEVVYCKSDEVRLDNKGDNFEAGQVDKFKVEMDEIGRPYKIRIGHDNSGAFAGWHLDRVRMADIHFLKSTVESLYRGHPWNKTKVATAEDAPL